MVRTLALPLVFALVTMLAPAGVHQPTINLPPNYEVISVDSAGNLHSGNAPSISADGYFVAFMSTDTGLVTGDTNGKADIFLRSRQANTTTRESVSSTGIQADGDSIRPSISGDGRYIVFSSTAANLVTGDTNNKTDIFLRDTQAHTTLRISVDSTGNQGDDDSFDAQISADGRFVVFDSLASNLVSGDTNGVADVFLYSIQTHTTSRVSLDSSGAQANDYSSAPAISADGRYVAFESGATNLVAGDTNGYTDIFLHDTQTGNTSLVSVSNAAQQANSSAGGAEISGDGRFVGFRSYATNLVPNDNNNGEDIFVNDTLNHNLAIWGNAFNNYYTGGFSLSYDGRYLAFETFSPNPMEVYRDSWTWSWENVSYQGEKAYGGVSLSGDGHLLAYTQELPPLYDSIVFVRSLPLDPCPLSSANTCTYLPRLVN